MGHFQHEPAPHEISDLPYYVETQFRRLVAALEETNHVRLEKHHAEPARPRDGMLVLADGTNWDPGSGAGFYGYNDGAWHFLG